jgi:subtilisin family serine protease
MLGRSRKRALFVVAGVAALAAACAPVTPPPPPPSTTTTTEPPIATSFASCGGTAVPTEAEPIEFVAVVDEPGAGAPEVVTFVATSDEDKDAQLEAIAEDGHVLAVDPNQPVAALAVAPGNDPLSTQQWGLTKSAFDDAWAAGFDGTGQRIAVIDSGVNATHEDLSGKVDVAAGTDFIAPGDGTADGNGHGTHVAGIAAASDNALGGIGAAPGATIVPVRVLDAGGNGTMDDVADGILWAADPAHGDADVLNLSLGGAHCSSFVEAAVAYAVSQGAVVVAAAGNGNNNVGVAPALYNDYVIAVGATTTTDGKATFSNYGTPYVDIGAPGVAVPSTWPFGVQGVQAKYRSLSGTSMATPLVAAAAALVRQHCPAATPSEVQAILHDNAGPMVNLLGAPRLDAGLAVAAACPSPPSSSTSSMPTSSTEPSTTTTGPTTSSTGATTTTEPTP